MGLRPRDKWFLGVLFAVGIAATIGGFALSTHGGSGGRCLDVTVPSTMGGATIHKCGSDAVRFCREQAGSALIAAECRKRGFSR